VHEHERRPFLWDRLPMAFASNSSAGLGFEIAGHTSRQAGKSPRQKSRDERLRVRIAQERVRFERLHSNFHLTTESTAPGTDVGQPGALDFVRRRA